MSSPLYEKLFALEKAQGNAFDEYYTSIQEATLKFADKVHLLSGLPAKTFSTKEGSKNWIQLYECKPDGKFDPKSGRELNSFERGRLSFGVGLALSSSLDSYPKQYHTKSYTLHFAQGKMVLVDLADEQKIYYIDTDEGLTTAAEQFLKDIEERLLSTPEETFSNG